MDLKRISSRVICSDNITRQNLNKKPSTSRANLIIDNNDDDDEFFQKIRTEIDKKHLLYSKESCRPKLHYPSANLERKKRPILDEVTQNIIKRFKRDSNHKHSVQSLDNPIIQANHVDNTIKGTCNTLRNISDEIISRKNMFSSDILNANFRIPNKCIFQMTSKAQMNVLPLSTDEMTILCEEYEESSFYGMMFLTPPNSNSNERIEDSHI